MKVNDKYTHMYTLYNSLEMLQIGPKTANGNKEMCNRSKASSFYLSIFYLGIFS